MAHDSDPSYVLGVAAAFIALCPLFTGVRFFVRLRSKERSELGVDDWLCLAATVFTIGTGVSIIVAIRLRVISYPAPNPDPGFQNFYHNRQMQLFYLLFHTLAIGSTKLSFLFFFRRVFFSGSGTIFRSISACIGILVICWTFGFFFALIFQCGADGLVSTWTHKPGTGNEAECQVNDVFFVVLAISDFLLDLLVIGLPLPKALRLHMRLSRKLLVLAIFGLGAVALVASAVRLAIYVPTLHALEDIHDHTSDDNYYLTIGRIAFWTMLETGLALIACSLPTFGPLLNTAAVSSLFHRIRKLLGRKSSDHSDSDFQKYSTRRLTEVGDDGRGRDRQMRERNESDETGMESSHGSRRGRSRNEGVDEGEFTWSETRPRIEIRVQHEISQTREVI